MDKWAAILKERLGENDSANPFSPDKIKIRELENKIKRIEMEHVIIKRLPLS